MLSVSGNKALLHFMKNILDNKKQENTLKINIIKQQKSFLYQIGL